MASPFLRGVANTFPQVFAQAFSQGVAAEERRGAEERARAEREAIRKEQERKQRVQQMYQQKLAEVQMQQQLLGSLLNFAAQSGDLDSAMQIAQLMAQPIPERFKVKEQPTPEAVDAQKRLAKIQERFGGELQEKLSQVLPGVVAQGATPQALAGAMPQAVTELEKKLAEKPERLQAFKKLQKQAEEKRRVPVLKDLPLDTIKIKKVVDPLEKELKLLRKRLLEAQIEAEKERAKGVKAGKKFDRLKTIGILTRDLITRGDAEITRLEKLRSQLQKEIDDKVNNMEIMEAPPEEINKAIAPIVQRRQFIDEKIDSLQERIAEAEATLMKAAKRMQELEGIEPTIDEKKDRDFQRLYLKALEEGFSAEDAKAIAVKRLADKYPDIRDLPRTKQLLRRAAEILAARNKPVKTAPQRKLERPTENERIRADIRNRFLDLMRQGKKTEEIIRTLVKEDAYDVQDVNAVFEQLQKGAGQRRKPPVLPPPRNKLEQRIQKRFLQLFKETNGDSTLARQRLVKEDGFRARDVNAALSRKE